MGRVVPPEDRRGVIRDLVSGKYRHDAIAEARGVAPSTVTRYKQILEQEWGPDLFDGLTTEPIEDGDATYARDAGESQWLPFVSGMGSIKCYGCEDQGYGIVPATRLYYYHPDEVLRPLCDEHDLHKSEVDASSLIAVIATTEPIEEGGE